MTNIRITAREAGSIARPCRMVCRLCLQILVATAVSACTTPQFLCPAPSGLKRLTILTEPGTNGGMATEIDLVFATDKKALKSIEQLKARDYFAQREQMLRDFSTGLKIRSFGLEPSQREIAYQMRPPCHLVATLLFVNYNNDKPNRVKIKKVSDGTLALGPDDFTWQVKQRRQ